MVTRTQIDADKPELVLAHIESWRTTVTDFETAADDYVRMVERPGGSYWSGRTADAAVEMSHTDRKTIYNGGDGITAMADRRITA